MQVMTHFPTKQIAIPENEKLIFLTGPIQGAPDWQDYATNVVTSLHAIYGKGTLHIANPRREYLDGSFDYPEQVAWEKAGLRRASKNGAVLVWFAAQDHSIPYEKDREYAKTTKDELQRAIGWMDNEPDLQLHVGIEPGFQSLSRYKTSCLEEYSLGKHTNLDILCRHVMKSIME